MDAHYDDLETRSPEAREAAQFAELPFQIAYAKQHAPYFRELLASVTPSAVVSSEALARLPVTRKSDLITLQSERPPFGGLVTEQPGRLARIFQSPGPIYDIEGHGRDYWRMARALFAAGCRAGEIIHNAFSYHLTPAAAMVESGARTLGCAVIPAGTGNVELQARAMADVRAPTYCGTPSFLKVLLDAAEERGVPLDHLRRASVAGEALPASLRHELEDRGVRVQQWYGTADLGMIAYESVACQGLIVDEGVIVEIVTPGTGNPVAAGEVGEVVVTLLNSREYPLIRFATGDLSAIMADVSPCGRTNMRLKGWLGRADQTTKVKGMFVHPHQVAEVVRRHPEILKARLVVAREFEQDIMTLYCETYGLRIDEVVRSLQSLCKLQGRVELTAPGSLPDDGKIIDDRRHVS